MPFKKGFIEKKGKVSLCLEEMKITGAESVQLIQFICLRIRFSKGIGDFCGMPIPNTKVETTSFKGSPHDDYLQIGRNNKVAEEPCHQVFLSQVIKSDTCADAPHVKEHRACAAKKPKAL